MYIEEDENYNQIVYITLSNAEGAFIDILEEFPNLVEKDLKEVECIIENIFPTSISISIEGDRFDIIEAISQIIEFLILLGITNFNFISHTVERID